MFLIPYRWLWITSPLTEDEAKRRISAHVDLTSPHHFFAIYSHKYGGSATAKGFSLNRHWLNPRSTISIKVEWHEIGSRVGVRTTAPNLWVFLITLPFYVAFLTVHTRYLIGASAVAAGGLMCLWYFFEQRSLIKDLQRMLANTPYL
jgi:hypothetical protein